MLLIKNYGVRRLEATKRYYIGMEPNPRINLNTKKEKSHYMKRLRKAWSNSPRDRDKPVHTILLVETPQGDLRVERFLKHFSSI